MDYHKKYLKYKFKYNVLKKQIGGGIRLAHHDKFIDKLSFTYYSLNFIYYNDKVFYDFIINHNNTKHNQLYVYEPTKENKQFIKYTANAHDTGIKIIGINIIADKNKMYFHFKNDSIIGESHKIIDSEFLNFINGCNTILPFNSNALISYFNEHTNFIHNIKAGYKITFKHSSSAHIDINQLMLILRNKEYMATKLDNIHECKLDDIILIDEANLEIMSSWGYKNGKDAFTIYYPNNKYKKGTAKNPKCTNPTSGTHMCK